MCFRSPAAFSIEAVSSKALNLYSVDASVPVKIVVKNGGEISVTDSSFETIPWPGFFIHNVTRAAFISNYFKDVAPKALVAKLGKLWVTLRECSKLRLIEPPWGRSKVVLIAGLLYYPK